MLINILVLLICAVIWDLHADNTGSALVHMSCRRNICLGAEAYASNMKCIDTSTCTYIVDYSELIRGIYTDIFVSVAQVLIGTCGLYVTFNGHISF